MFQNLMHGALAWGTPSNLRRGILREGSCALSSLQQEGSSCGVCSVCQLAAFRERSSRLAVRFRLGIAFVGLFLPEKFSTVAYYYVDG